MNSRGTCILVDPVLEGFDIPLPIDMSLNPEAVPQVEAILITHSDNDHYSIPTIKKLIPVTTSFHGPIYVANLIQEHFGIEAIGQQIYDTFQINDLTISLTQANLL